MKDLSDQEQTRKIQCIRRRRSIEELAAMERASLAHFERQAEIARERLRALGVAA